jgi:hypothetical protein
VYSFLPEESWLPTGSLPAYSWSARLSSEPQTAVCQVWTESESWLPVDKFPWLWAWGIDRQVQSHWQHKSNVLTQFTLYWRLPAPCTTATQNWSFHRSGIWVLAAKHNIHYVRGEAFTAVKVDKIFSGYQQCQLVKDEFPPTGHSWQPETILSNVYYLQCYGYEHVRRMTPECLPS